MSGWSQVRRVLYKTQRSMGDVSAARRGRLGRRLIRREVTRSVWRWFR